MNKPFAAFDIDGTLIRWQLYHAVTDELGRRGHLDQHLYQTVKDARLNWKKRNQNASFVVYEKAVVTAYNEAVMRLSVSEVDEIFDKIIDQYRDQVYIYTRELISELKSRGYLIFALSGSQNEIVAKLAEYYGFDDSQGTNYEIEDGAYTGKSEVVRSAKKPEYLQALVEKHDATFTHSYAVGDSASDILMLEMVEHPIAFNPSDDLKMYAMEQGWRIVVERKDTVYQLVADKHGYRLEQ